MGYNQQVWRVWILISIELIAAAPHDAKPLPTIRLSTPKPLPDMLSCASSLRRCRAFSESAAEDRHA